VRKGAPLTVLECGVASAVGLSAAATYASIRARIDGFRETRFMAQGGGWIVGAEAPLDGAWRGVHRLAHLLAGPVRECLEQVPEMAPEAIPVLLGVAEPDRPGRFARLDHDLGVLLQEILGVRFHPASRVLALGRIAAAIGLRDASTLLNEQGCKRAIVACVDTYLSSATLAAFHARRRLLSPANSNGFIPGEAAAALLVAPGGSGPGLDVLSLGLGVENATIESEEPMRGDGLAAAFAHALRGAELEMAGVGYRIGTMSGEQYWFREFDLATSRLLRGRHDFMDLWHPADCIGEAGAASLPVGIGLALIAARKNFAAGDPVLLAAANDDGRRAALVVAAGGSG
jgi:3-oxoacyl-[acyl-carrier-protein] synthase-1